MPNFHSEVLLAALVAVPNGVIVTSREGTILWVNPAFSRTTGYSAAEAVGQNTRLLKSGVHDASFYRRLWTTILAGEVWAGEIVNRRKDGSTYVEEQTITPVRDSSGAISHFIAIKQDITARQEMEAQLRQAQKMEAVGRLAGGVAHDFNNLLTVIVGRAYVLKHRLGADAELRRDVELIDHAAQRAAGLTRQLLAFSRKQAVQPQILDVNAVVAGMEPMLRRLIGEDIELVTRLEPTVGRVTADSGQVEQIILNLAVNARDALPQGGRVTIETQNAELDVGYARRHAGLRPGQYVMLAVSDDGIGMDAETQARLFEPFFTTKEPGKGTGLGLTTVYAIVKQSGGNVFVYSEPGVGTTVKVYLPQVNAASAGAEPGRPPEALVRGSETVLLVEDEAGLRELVHEILESRGYTVLAAQHPGEALLVSERHAGPIHLVLTDVIMPGMSGRALADRLLSARPQTRVLYMSGYTAEAIGHHRVLEVGEAFIQKPFAPDTFLRRIREVLDAPSS